MLFRQKCRVRPQLAQATLACTLVIPPHFGASCRLNFIWSYTVYHNSGIISQKTTLLFLQSPLQKRATMNGRSLSKAIRLPIARQAVPVQRRTIVSAFRTAAARPTVRAAPAAPAAPAVQTRGVKTVDFAGHKEVVFGKLYSIHVEELLLMLSLQSVRIGQERSSL
jgi:hypothetical protein